MNGVRVGSGNFDRVDGHHNRVFAGVYHPTDPNIFITGGWDNSVQFWDSRVQGSVRFVSASATKAYNLHVLTPFQR